MQALLPKRTLENSCALTHLCYCRLPRQEKVGRFRSGRVDFDNCQSRNREDALRVELFRARQEYREEPRSRTSGALAAASF